MNDERTPPPGEKPETEQLEEKQPYEPPRVESVRLSEEAAEALT